MTNFFIISKKDNCDCPIIKRKRKQYDEKETKGKKASKRKSSRKGKKNDQNEQDISKKF